MDTGAFIDERPGVDDVGSSVEANDREVTRRWARHPRCVALARGELRKTLTDWGLIQIEDAALLVLSELLTNAVCHARVSPGGRSRHAIDLSVMAYGSRSTTHRTSGPFCGP
jgi:hypothetical protein